MNLLLPKERIHSGLMVFYDILENVDIFCNSELTWYPKDVICLDVGISVFPYFISLFYSRCRNSMYEFMRGKAAGGHFTQTCYFKKIYSSLYNESCCLNTASNSNVYHINKTYLYRHMTACWFFRWFSSINIFLIESYPALLFPFSEPKCTYLPNH